MVKVIFDTNFLLIPCLFKVDIFAEADKLILEKYSSCIVEQSIRELKKIMTSGNGREKRAALFALSIIKKKKLEILFFSGKDADSAILEAARANDIIVATQDRELKIELKKLKKKTLVLRQKSHLELQA
ncbi:hypothetical protein J4401_07290 [Candidatus Woesearchaeota archaeon]|nr:hypothetical protein [Candidatus Woesearchaeota archaeon]